MSQGIIALDIDGTVTDGSHTIPEGVRRYLAALSKSWEILFITGRSFHYGHEVLQVCDFPYTYAAYNGALTYRMPERELLRSHYLDIEVLPHLEAACQSEALDYLLHYGGAQQARVLYRPDRLDPGTRDYLPTRMAAAQEPWEAVADYGDVVGEGLCYAKVFGRRDPLLRVAQAMQPDRAVATVVHDPLREGYSVLLLTDPMATKGAALRECRGSGPVIAAGDDTNDISMLAEADYAIVMETAPSEVKGLADLIAPPSTQEGIIVGLTRAIEELTP